MGDYSPYSLAEQEEAEQRKSELAKLRRDVEKADLLFVMDNERGRRFIWRILESAGVFRSSFDESAALMAFREGSRNIGLSLLAQITDTCPAQFLIMQEEQNGRRNPIGDHHDRAERGASTDTGGD
jgi:hypothetical protein